VCRFTSDDSGGSDVSRSPCGWRTPVGIVPGIAESRPSGCANPLTKVFDVSSTLSDLPET
jgi:hypothetical protein